MARASTSHSTSKVSPVPSEDVTPGTKVGIPVPVSDRYLAICADELKPVVTGELTALGATDVTDGFRAVYFTADPRTALVIHLRLASASRILSVRAAFSATTLNIVGSRLNRVKFHEWFAPDAGYMIEGIAGDRGPNAPSSNDVSKAVRLAVENVFERYELPRPRVDLKEPKVVIVAYFHAGHFTLSLDTSGKSLHKRGYRLEPHPAPLKENLAAGLLHLIGYDGSTPFMDPMCGSGTIAVEASFIALGKAPLIHRSKGDFGFEWLKGFDRQMWREVQDEARAVKATEPPHPIVAADIEPLYIESARKNALRARVEKHIDFRTGSFFDATAPSASGTLVANLPYGSRLDAGRTDWKQFYIDVGNALKRKFTGWRAGLLVAEESDYKFIGLKPKRKIPIMNGAIPCRFLIFELY